MFSVYMIQNVLNGAIYIGKTNDTHTRWLQHKNKNRCLASKQYVHKAMLKYGVDNFKFSVLEEYTLEQDASDAEIWLISYYKSLGAKLYNLTDGGDGASSGRGNYWFGKTFPQEMKDKISRARIGKYGGENNPMYGRNHTLEVKLKISNTNKQITDIIVEKIRNLAATKQYTGRQLAKMFDVSTAQISRIKNRKQRAL